MLLPSFKTKEEKAEKDHSVFVLEPLEPGFGNTLGVALRRVLLTSIEGAAITSVQIKGVRHMFSTLPGLKEDIVEFILNLKGVRIRLLDSKNEGTLVLKKSGPSVITAADIEPSENIEIVNKDHYLGSLADKKAEIEAKMMVEKGLGYSLAEERKVTTIGVIPVDAIYTPVKKVSYRVEQTRVGRQTNYEKLILDIWTDGTISPREALDAAAKILVSYFNNIYEPRDTERKSEEKRGKDVSRDLLNLTIEELELPTRIYNSLRNAGIQTVGQLLSTPKKDLLSFRNLGAKSLSVIEKSLKEKGISQEL